MPPSSIIRSSKPFSLSALYVLILASSSAVLADLPLVNFDRMGRVGLAGSFAGLDVAANSSSSFSFDPTTSTLLSRTSDGELTRLGSTDVGGTILTACTLDGTVYVAGNFSSIGGTSASNIASYSPSSGSFTALGQGGPNNVIHSLFCDDSNNNVWSGGKFSSPAPSVAIWNTKSSSWSSPPFGGLSGAGGEVLSIVPNSSHNSLVFTGSFLASFGNSSVALNGTNNPNVPFSAGATPFSSSLVPVPLADAHIDPSPSTTLAGFDNINNTLCPIGPDGAGNSWFAQDGAKAVVTVRKFQFLSASGIRLGNTFIDGRGTTGFSVTTIPDNAVRTLHYTDPHTGQNQSCSDPCPLLTDPAIPYQDFLFDSSLDITGFQLTLSQWQGASSGLHLLQLLSSGAFASSVDADNGVSCFAPNASSTARTGTWIEKDVQTNIPGTIQAVLVSDVNVNTSPAQTPTFTWRPYVSTSGDYTVNLLIPGCTNLQDCALRTSVTVTVFPGDGQSPVVTTVSQQNTDDTVKQIYSGPVVPTTPDFSMTISMALSNPPAGNGQNGQYELVADRVQLVLNSANITSVPSGNGTNSTSTSAQTSFGFLEWPLSQTDSVTTTGVLPNTSLTSLDSAGITFFNALGGSSSLQTISASIISAAVQHPSGTIFVGGSFSLSSGSAQGALNIAQWKDEHLAKVSGNGLDSSVSALVLSADGRTLFAGGSFKDTSDKSTNSKLSGVASYDVQNDAWAPLNGGVNGAVEGLELTSDNLLLVVGNFTETGDGTLANGLAAWNLTSNTWISSGGFLVGKMTFVGNSTAPSKSDGQSQLLAGSISASFKFSAAGFVTIQNGESSSNGMPKITPFSVQVQGSPNMTSSSMSNITANVKRHRAHNNRRSSIFSGWVGGFFRRQSDTTANLAPLPTIAPSNAPSILAGAYWTNSSTKRENAILGGNFTYTSTNGGIVQNIAVYDIDAGAVTALPGNQVNGTVRSLFVQDDSLYIGGSFSVSGTNFDGFAVYNLAREEWDTVGFQPLSGTSGSSASGVVVRSITAPTPESNAIIVGGSFSQGGSTSCRAICSFNTENKAWSALGNGIQGEVSSVSYAGSSRDTIVAAGSLALADGTGANVAEYSISNNTWSTVGGSGQLPGPVTAVEVNNGNSSSIFAAGKSTDGTSSFLSFWNGESWNAVGSSFESATDVSQLTMVPLQNTHSVNGIIEPDRMLWISGSLADSSFGNASSALFDGQQIIPYVVSSTSAGNPGTIASLIFSNSVFTFSQRHFLATGIVILISIAIAAGVVFWLALVGILWTLFARREDKLDKYDPAGDDDDDSMTHRPSSLLEHINAATRTTIIGSPYGPQDGEKVAEAAGTAPAATSSSDPFGPDASNFARADTPSDALGGLMAGEETSRPAHARYSFDGAGEGELPMTAGQELEILDDRDAA
ncbi:cortical protein marker for cell polarity-domain-containing protein [Irpex rosettiformis]|uniref:Cortical protein marker for cell polarity-domain-containing protein n=1 Tax=Irpex rosettiformis TaxID=378272 RepID=A0ACB8U192_9APHY|nr:cortical protein marker for cell polarity-domain-containing protein [Irpex rosettiformis]